MMKRLPYKDTFFEHLSFLESTIALFHEGRNKIRNLNCIGRLAYWSLRCSENRI